MSKSLVVVIAGFVSLLFPAATGLPAAPIKLHPENPHYFLFRERPTVLITSGEHYGAVLNLDFDYSTYLNVLQKYDFNLTRVFSGAYREIPGSFNITGNTLAPKPGRFVYPWTRSEIPGASEGGNKFDLEKWDDAYFRRLKDFVTQAGKRGIVAEIVLFCTMYSDALWDASPMNIRNNVNNAGKVGPYEVYSGKDKELLSIQRAMVRKIVTELNSFDNVYFEICNEPYERGGLTKEWNDDIVATIIETEKSLPRTHLIAQGFPSGKLKEVNPNVSVLNFHAAKPDVVHLNYGLRKVLAFDETGGSDQSDRKYRTEGWEFMLAGGGVYDHLDFSFTTEQPDGLAVPLPRGTPGGGGPELRQQLQILKKFLERLDFIHMKPRNDLVESIQFTTGKGSFQLLAQEGKSYALCVNGGSGAEIKLKLPAGEYKVSWLKPTNGKTESTETFNHGGGARLLRSPPYSEDIALRVSQ